MLSLLTHYFYHNFARSIKLNKLIGLKIYRKIDYGVILVELGRLQKY